MFPQIDRGSFLLGLVLGLAIAAIIMSGSIVLSPRIGAVVAANERNDRQPDATPSLVAAVGTPRPSPTASPTTEPTPKPTATSTPTPVATPSVAPLHYETVDVPARKFTVLQIASEAGQTLEATVQVQSDIDLTVFAPDGSPVLGPTRVNGTYTLRQTSAASGNWALKLDNSFSWLTDKQVLVQYRLLSR